MQNTMTATERVESLLTNNATYQALLAILKNDKARKAMTQDECNAGVEAIAKARLNAAQQLLELLTSGLQYKFPTAGVTFGYIGNLEAGYDDRNWRFFTKLEKGGKRITWPKSASTDELVDFLGAATCPVLGIEAWLREQTGQDKAQPYLVKLWSRNGTAHAWVMATSHEQTQAKVKRDLRMKEYTVVSTLACNKVDEETAALTVEYKGRPSFRIGC